MAPNCPGRNVALCFELSSTIFEDSGDGLSAPNDCDTLRFLQSLPSCQIRQGYWIGHAASNRDSNAETSLCGAQGATLAFVTTATMLADALTKALVHCPSLLAAINARRYVFVTSHSSRGVKKTLTMPSEPVPTLKTAIGSQLIRSAEHLSSKF